MLDEQFKPKVTDTDVIMTPDGRTLYPNSLNILQAAEALVEQLKSGESQKTTEEVAELLKKFIERGYKEGELAAYTDIFDIVDLTEEEIKRIKEEKGISFKDPDSAEAIQKKYAVYAN